MKAGIIFTGTGPILVLTSYDSLADPGFAQKMSSKGIMKFIAHELDTQLVSKRYGKQFEVIEGDLLPSEDIRVLDYNGHNVFFNFTYEEMGPPIFHE